MKPNWYIKYNLWKKYQNQVDMDFYKDFIVYSFIVCPDFDILTASCTWHTHWVSLTQYWDDDVTKWRLNFKILRKSFMNEYLIWKFLLFLIFIFLSTLVHEITIWTFLNFFLGWWQRGAKTLRFWDKILR